MRSAEMPHGLAFFENVFIINLVARLDRRREMEEQLAGIGVAPTDVNWFAAVKPDDPAGFPSIGARGCFLSHLGVLQQARAQGLQRILLLEDDCNFIAGFGDALAFVTSELTAGWDFFYGGAAPERSEDFGRTVRRIPSDAGVLQAHFVALNGPAIAMAVDYLEAQLRRPPGHSDGGPMPVDGSYSWLRRAAGLRTYIAEPALCYQRSSASDITPKLWDRVPVARRAIGMLRRLKG